MLVLICGDVLSIVLGQGLFIVGKVRRSLKRSLKIVRFLADFPTVCKQWND